MACSQGERAKIRVWGSKWIAWWVGLCKDPPWWKHQEGLRPKGTSIKQSKLTSSTERSAWLVCAPLGKPRLSGDNCCCFIQSSFSENCLSLNLSFKEDLYYLPIPGLQWCGLFLWWPKRLQLWYQVWKLFQAMYTHEESEEGLYGVLADIDMISYLLWHLLFRISATGSLILVLSFVHVFLFNFQ